MSKRAKRCPFCASYVKHGTSEGGWVQCVTEGCAIGEELIYCSLDQWNRRDPVPTRNPPAHPCAQTAVGLGYSPPKRS